ncbi:MAG: pseudouridine synthase [Peptoniphilaceae bacterium]|nr:rRNA pseudouridine synthase [Peptoniphilaceae bacterium]MDD7383029.1 pseudouridine synthase [Peptoniphilaceae bacterium]MDY3737780.1 pseudouridine synthase [Peptoniphilaceae bacterium]
MRLNKYIAHSGICSRRKADELIKKGFVSVNGKIVKDFSSDVNIEDDVKIFGKKIIPENKVYIKLNKPVGFISSNYDPHNKNSVIDLVKVEERIFPIGRLDKDSHGLILLTNDGEISNKIIHPSKKIDKEYIVKVSRNLKEYELEKFRSGILIDGKKTSDANIEKINEKLYKVIIHEGMNRQIRKMFKYFNVYVLDLKRIKIGEIKLDNLEEGKFVRLTSKEIKYLRNLK